MIKLSRRAWNNVIIFSMLILIFLFNSTSNFLNGGADSEQPSHLIPHDAVIASLDFGDVKVERIGQGWRAVGIDVQLHQLVELNQAWLNAKINNAANELSISQASNSRIVFISVLGQQSPLKFEVFEVNGNTLVLSQQRLYQLIDTPYNSLIIESDSDA
ncbi:MAG: hypothetical protein NWQ26_12305 [Paraglaciecola sp.]|nr:hypothetical protein [Paraglaciecola sp.]